MRSLTVLLLLGVFAAVYAGYEHDHHPGVCLLDPDGGKCLAYFERYYYDRILKKCKKFIYGGCGGNANRFDTYEDCVNTCGPLPAVSH